MLMTQCKLITTDYAVEIIIKDCYYYTFIPAFVDSRSPPVCSQLYTFVCDPARAQNLTCKYYNCYVKMYIIIFFSKQVGSRYCT